MKTNKPTEEIEINVPMRDSLRDYQREREILAQESIDNKNAFADNIKDTLGEQIKTELAKKYKPEKKLEEKSSGIKKFLDKLSKVCR